MIFRLRLAVLALAAIAAGCRPDSPSITEVEATLDHHPERVTCHFEPEAIKTVEGEDEVVLIEFTYGGGATWIREGGLCPPLDPNLMSGALLASHGVSYSDSIGGDGDILARKDCALVTGGDSQPCNVPSLPNAIWIDYLLGSSGYLRFDPPVSEVSFRVCSNQSHGLTAWDSLGNLIVPETVGPSNGSYQGFHLFCETEGWEEFGIQASGYDIARVRLRHWDSGLTFWDDMTFRRKAPPAIVCDTVIRGVSTTCSVKPEVLAGLDSANAVTDWKFTPSDGTLTSIQGPSWVNEWSGPAVLSGDVEALGWSGSDSVPLHGELVVNDREGAEWEWTMADWGFEDDSAMVGCPIPHWNKFGPSDTTVLGVNLRRTTCAPNSVEPVVADQSSDPGFAGAQVPNGGPNGGLWYVVAADYSMDRGSLINPSVLPGYPPDVLGKKDSKTCPDSLRAGPGDAAVVNFYQYNTQCQSLNLQPLYDGIHRHEGYGTGGQSNGHEARRRLGAASPSSYPAAAAESIVAADSANLDFRVRLAVDLVDVVITEESDPLHILVNDNFSTSVFARSQTGQGNYTLRTVHDAN